MVVCRDAINGVSTLHMGYILPKIPTFAGVITPIYSKKHMQIIDGRLASAAIKAEIAEQVRHLTAGGGRRPKLAAILVGSDGASITYVARKERACAEAGLDSEVFRLPAEASEEEVLALTARLNADPHTDGFIVQLPLPAHINPSRIIEAISPLKDVDGFHPVNVGRMAAGLPCLMPATPLGIAALLRHYDIPTDGRHCVILGRSGIVGRPLSIMLSQREFNCTVTLCHSGTRDLAGLCRQADILVAAMGQPNFVSADMIKRGAAAIDVGTTRLPDPSCQKGWRLAGDIRFGEAAARCSYITPVPFGVGPMTIAALLQNTLRAHLLQKSGGGFF